MALNCGIIGLTNTGKTTIFNCMSNTKAESSTYAFSATKSNKGIVDVPDPRLYKIDELIKSEKVIPATVEIVDVPGLAKGASEGEGVGNKFLADIQQTDALIHVVRCFDDDSLPHIEGSVDPARDIDIVILNYRLEILTWLARKIKRLEKPAGIGDKDARKAIEILRVFKDHLENFGNARTAPVNEDDFIHIQDMQLLTAKPMIYVCNVDDASAVNGNKYVEEVKNFLNEDEKDSVLVIAGKLEEEIAELDKEDRMDFLSDANLEEPSVNKLIRAAYKILNLAIFFYCRTKRSARLDHKKRHEST